MHNDDVNSFMWITYTCFRLELDFFKVVFSTCSYQIIQTAQLLYPPMLLYSNEQQSQQSLLDHRFLPVTGLEAVYIWQPFLMPESNLCWAKRRRPQYFDFLLFCLSRATLNFKRWSFQGMHNFGSTLPLKGTGPWIKFFVSLQYQK